MRILFLFFILALPLVSEASQATPVTEPTVPVAGAENKPKRDDADKFHEETLVGNGDIDHGGYGGPTIKFSRMAGRDIALVGGRGGWLINHRFLIGGGGFGTLNDPEAPSSVARRLHARFPLAEDDWRFNVGYGGFMLEYLIAPSKVVHGTAAVLLGGGGITVGSRRAAGMQRDDEPMRAASHGDSFFLAEPEVGVELNVAKFFRVAATGSYRLVTGIGGMGLENDDLRGFSGGLTLKFGAF